MFNKLSKTEMLESFKSRKSEIKNIDKLPSLDKSYLFFLSKYEGSEITPDIDIFGYEQALKENRYLETNYPDISQVLWMIGRTGQGDEWFISKEESSILFYDHNQGEYSNFEQFVDFNVSFPDFLQMASLYRQLENLLDEQGETDKNVEDNFVEIINSIQPNLYEKYPFKYF